MPRVLLGAKNILGMQQAAMSKVITKSEFKHVVDRLRSEGYEDEWQH